MSMPFATCFGGQREDNGPGPRLRIDVERGSQDFPPEDIANSAFKDGPDNVKELTVEPGKEVLSILVLRTVPLRRARRA